MKKIITTVSITVLISCNTTETPPYTYAQYDSIVIDMQNKREVEVRAAVRNPSLSLTEGAAIGKKWNRLIDSVNRDRMKYYNR